MPFGQSWGNIILDANMVQIERGISVLNIKEDINSLSSFKRNTAEFVRRMKKSRRPIVLTVNGKPELVVQDAESYQKLLDWAEYEETLAAIKEGFEDVENGRVRPVEEAFEELRRKLGLPG